MKCLEIRVCFRVRTWAHACAHAYSVRRTLYTHQSTYTVLRIVPRIVNVIYFKCSYVLSRVSARMRVRVRKCAHTLGVPTTTYSHWCVYSHACLCVRACLPACVCTRLLTRCVEEEHEHCHHDAQD